MDGPPASTGNSAPRGSLRQGILAALLTRPRARDFGRMALEAAWLVPLLLAIGWLGGLMHWRPTFDATIARLALVAVVAPALGEELLFRAALLPNPAPARWPFGAMAASVALFVVWHPLQALVFGPHWAETVLDPWFLAAVAATGLALARLYLATGSIWPCVLLHWLVVVGWKALLGGPSPWLPS